MGARIRFPPARARLRAAAILLILAGAGLASASPASAATVSASGVIARSPAPTVQYGSPFRGAALDLDVAFSLTYARPTDSLSHLTVLLATGMTVHPAAVSADCSASQFAADACPAAAQIATGTAEATPQTVGSSAGTGAGESLTVTLYAAPATDGDVLGLDVVLRDPTSGAVATSTGRIAETTVGGHSRYALGLDAIPSGFSGFSGASGTGFSLTSLDLQLSGRATSVTGQVDQGAVFITQPATCSAATIALAASTLDGQTGSLRAGDALSGCPATRPQPSLDFGFILASGTGGNRIAEVKLRLPRGLSFTGSALGRALQVGGASERFELDHGQLVIRLGHVQRRVSVEIGPSGLAVSAGAPHRPRVSVTVTREDHKATHLDFTLGLQR